MKLFKVFDRNGQNCYYLEVNIKETGHLMRKKSQQKFIRVPYGYSVHGKEEIAAVVKVLKGNTALGEKTKEFESKIAKIFGKNTG